MTYRELISNVTSPYNKGFASRSSRLMPAYIISILHKYRSSILKNYITTKIGKVSPTTIQKIDCFQLEEAPKVDCDCVLGFKSKCKLLKSVYELPTVSSGEAIHSVTGYDSNFNPVIFSRTTFDKAKLYKNNRFDFLKNQNVYYISNQHLYVITENSNIRMISVEGIFDNPLDVYELNSLCGSNSCINIFDENFPLEGHLITQVTVRAIDEIFNLWTNKAEDKVNNERTDT